MSPNRSYQKGADTERDLVKLITEGRDPRQVTATRSAGSHGAADVIATTKYPGREWRRFAFNVKRNGWCGPDERARMVETYAGQGYVMVMANAIVRRSVRTVWWFRFIAPDGSMSEPTQRAPWA